MSFKWNEKFKSKEKLFLSMIETDKEQFYRIAYSYIKNEQDALDILQETIAKAYANLSKLRETAYMKTWFTRILINTAINMRSQQSRVIPDAFIEARLDQQEQTSTALGSQTHEKQTTDKLDLMASLNTLNDKEKAIVVLRFFEDFKLEDVSRAVDLPLNTTKTILYRALKKMKISLEEV